MRSLFALALLALSTAGCATMFFQTDGFPEKMRSSCASKAECEALLAEATDRVRRCKDNTVGYLRCDDAKADLAWVNDRVGEFQAREYAALEEQNRERQARERAEAEERERARLEQKRRDEEEAAERARLAAEEQAEAEWRAAEPARCKAADSPDACTALALYLERRKEKGGEGKHDLEAKAVFVEAWPRVRGLRDDAAWKAVDLASCKRPRTLDDCDGVTRYLEAFPDGRHAKDANAALASATPTMKLLEAAEERKRAAARRAASAASDDDDTTYYVMEDAPIYVRSRRDIQRAHGGGHGGSAGGGHGSSGGKKASGWARWRARKGR